MITGSLASTFHGEPRATHDVDLVVLLRPEQVSKLSSEFQAPDFYLDDDAAKAAIRERSMFNLLDSMGGDKVDFWLLTDEPFDKERFRRRKCEDLGGFEAYIATAEDTILAKLRWAKLAGVGRNAKHPSGMESSPVKAWALESELAALLLLLF